MNLPFPHRFKMNFRRHAEYITVRGLMSIFGLLPLDIASAFGGFLGQIVGPITGLHRHAQKNITLIFPKMPVPERTRLLKEMWNNLGRTIAEYPHLRTIMNNRIIFDNRAGVSLTSLKDRPAIFISGHFANWEIAGPALLKETGIPLHLLYRAANNRAVDRLLNRYRSMNGQLETIPKSRGGMRQLIGLLNKNEKIGILIDQKYNEGLHMPFFGQMATSSDAYVHLSQKMGCPVYPAQIIRTGGAHFKIILYPSLALTLPDGTLRPAQDVVGDAHTLLENWMQAAPSQWLWVHRRWGKQENTQ